LRPLSAPLDGGATEATPAAAPARGRRAARIPSAHPRLTRRPSSTARRSERPRCSARSEKRPPRRSRSHVLSPSATLARRPCRLPALQPGQPPTDGRPEARRRARPPARVLSLPEDPHPQVARSGSRPASAGTGAGRDTPADRRLTGCRGGRTGLRAPAPRSDQRSRQTLPPRPKRRGRRRTIPGARA
jgi:hypothetical protein